MNNFSTSVHYNTNVQYENSKLLMHSKHGRNLDRFLGEGRDRFQTPCNAWFYSYDILEKAKTRRMGEKDQWLLGVER